MVMRVLVVGTLPSAVERASSELAAAGHEVLLCHEPGEPPFPCAALEEGRSCPLDGAPVDVVVTARDRPWPRPSPFEDGAVCALRRHLPLVVAGGLVHPFRRWVTAEVHRNDDLVAACEEAAAAPLTRHGEIATAAISKTLEQSGVDAVGASATVHRREGALRVHVSLPGAARSFEEMVVAKVVADLRAYDTYAGSIDVAVA